MSLTASMHAKYACVCMFECMYVCLGVGVHACMYVNMRLFSSHTLLSFSCTSIFKYIKVTPSFLKELVAHMCVHCAYVCVRMPV